MRARIGYLSRFYGRPIPTLPEDARAIRNAGGAKPASLPASSSEDVRHIAALVFHLQQPARRLVVRAAGRLLIDFCQRLADRRRHVLTLPAQEEHRALAVELADLVSILP